MVKRMEKVQNANHCKMSVMLAGKIEWNFVGSGRVTIITGR